MSGPSAPPPFSSLTFPSSTSNPHAKEDSLEYQLDDDPPAFQTRDPLENSSAASTALPSQEQEFSAALDQEDKDPSGPCKDVDDGEPPPPYSEGSSPLESFTYIMAANGGPNSIITQVSQGGGQSVNALGSMLDFIRFTKVHTRPVLTILTDLTDVGADEILTLELRYNGRFDFMRPIRLY